ncbi:pilus assembly protein [Burkholderia ubonensis]|nr:fimbria/pilus periplasmic chaperone [Burkholderia ubonensis]KVO87714.1 pilus assembly protein [Burkholderia ubonensis]KVZ57340.1 pilus assembly protein [Burkholderia ubonensis]KVZ73038.1 pilus assembly protein [Burkholderia ubonensis]
MKITYSIQALVTSLAFCASQAHAGVIISGTRVVFPGNEREVTVKVSNEGKHPALVQAWLDAGAQNESPDKIDVPFILSPTMFRLDPGKGQAVRMIHSGEPMPTDKESLYWLNFLEIPPKADSNDKRNKIQVAFRSRIKVMYRPAGLPGSAEEAPAQLKWSMAKMASGKYALKATNPTPYVVNLSSVSLISNAEKYDAGAGYVLPGETQEFAITGLNSAPAAGAKVQAGAINDWGATFNLEKVVSRTQ